MLKLVETFLLNHLHTAIAAAIPTVVAAALRLFEKAKLKNKWLQKIEDVLSSKYGKEITNDVITEVNKEVSNGKK